ncbi:hypothetical protein SIAM614_02691 [Stappia aggregata IAM 12614]|uniref:Uncharacterized protein n=1 Tax=Roseibium aggregatum (strain ATCC 25650 / DSM 13394 / JCM 20685 / NBRC 16684 / NCIMB 2208 / IAM 12614 / B1) TaxID=384765 RepID=A0NUE7_ROSAI|nr:hypothetical protein SIAM614_02691 [Stappia aggregata IAM 12614] [Roseibium aggregatum IAM 12614]
MTDTNFPSPNLPSQQSLTPLERGLLSLVERLTNAFEHSTAQLEHLERRSTGLLDERLTELETLLDRSISSQRTFNEALLDLLSAPESSGRSVEELCSTLGELSSVYSKRR